MKKDGNTIMGIAVLITIIVITLATISLGCTESPDSFPVNNSENDTNATDNIPDTNSEEYISGTAVVEDVEILILESFPVQVHAVAKGYLPDGCTEIDENIDIKREDNVFDVNIKTVRPKDMICTEAIVPFEQVIELDVYGLKKGTYNVSINGIETSFELSMDNSIPE